MPSRSGGQGEGRFSHAYEPLLLLSMVKLGTSLWEFVLSTYRNRGM